MHGAEPSASAAAAAAPSSSSSLAVGSQSDLQRKPTWAQISFDDGFDLNLGATSMRSVAQNGDAPMGPQTTTQYQSKAIPVHPHASPPVQHSERLAASPASTNKALPQVPSLFGTPLDNPSTAVPNRPLPTSESQTASASPLTSSNLASDVHSRVPSSQDGAPTPKPPSTPKGRASASPVVTAATPKQPQYASPAVSNNATPVATRPPSSGGPAWDRPARPSPPRPVSSADAYMQPVETLQSETSSRAGTAMSHLSGSNWMHDGPSNRSSLGTTASAPLNSTKRASVLSFQTANSAGFTSGDEARYSDREDAADETLVAPSFGAANAAASQSNQVRPWFDRDISSSTATPNERSIPGGLPGSFWDDTSSQPSVGPTVPTAAAAAQQTTDSSTGAVRSDAADVLTNHENAKADQVRDIRNLAVTEPESILTPINTQGLAHASSSGPLSSTTIAAPSDETTQAMRRSPELGRDRRPSAPFPQDNAPLPPAKDARSNQPSISFDQRQDPAVSLAAADNVVPPPLPVASVDKQPPLASEMLMTGPADHKPVSDYRKKPLADISPAQKAAGLAHLQSQAKAAKQPDAHVSHAPPQPPPSDPPPEAPPIPVLERARRKSNASLTANVALAQADSSGAPGLSRGVSDDRPDTPSADSISAESSAPPDGEVEARAEWERRRRMKRKNGKKQTDTAKVQKGRSDGFQLKPLQLVPADNINGFADRNGGIRSAARGDGDRSTAATAPTQADGSKQIYSTQQLQKLQAREQRRSVGAFSAAMAAANVVSSGSNGPYPIFASPNTGPQKVGSRQYPGLMAQRSLVPPFELQHRPDGLPSGLIGPDGVRRSLNDPEVCLECMMRDEDMIDIRVVGDGIWERESDREFEEAVRLEAEEAAGSTGINGPSGSSGHGDSIGSHRDSRGSRRPRKRLGKGEALTVERLKLHTQMNPPASSFRWRTLQTFLAVQAKYIAMEQQRMRHEADKRARQTSESISSRGSMIVLDAPASVQQPERNLSSPFAPPREASSAAVAPSRQSMLQTSTDEGGLTLQQKQDKERDVAAAQAARKKMTGGAAPAAAPPMTTPPLGLPAYPVTPLQTRTLAKAMPARSGSDPEEQLGGPAVTGGVVTPISGRRAPFASAQAVKASSVQDLRAAADASRSASTGYPPSPADSLMPPSRSVMGTSPSGTPSRLASRSGASQLSLMHSGSMIDMHVAQEDRAEHRINQTGFLPGTPIGVESPAALNRSFYGFPGDGDSSVPDATAFERSRMVSSDGYVNPMEAGPRGLDMERDDSAQRKKKGFRGLFSKLTGSSGGLSREDSAGATGAGSLNGSIASRNASKRSQGSGNGSPGARKNSFSADRSLDAVSPSLNGMLGKARMSTSSLFRNGADGDSGPKARTQRSGSNSLFQNPPGMASQNSLDLGPFQPASPQSNAYASVNGRVMPASPLQQQHLQNAAAMDPARMRKASNPLMEKYLNSPSPQTLASPVSGGMPMSQPSPGYGMTGERGTVHSSDVRNGRMSSFASMRDLRPSVLQSIPDSDQHADDTVAQQPLRFSGTSASSRKELPSMPSAADERDHQRIGTSGSGSGGGVRSSMVDSVSSASRSPGLAPSLVMTRPDGSGRAEYAGRASMQGSRSARPEPPSINADVGYGTIPDDASVGSAGPARPPKNPRRPDGALNSPSFVDVIAGYDGLAPPRRDFPQQGRSRSDAYTGVMGSPSSAEKTKKSIFRLPFGRKRRESTMAAPIDGTRPSIVVGGGADGFDAGPAAPPRSTSSSFLPRLLPRKSFSGLGVPRASFQTERQRVLSSPAPDASLGRAPPRSQSAFGMAPTKRFMSMDIPRRSMNVGRASARNRLSTVQYGADEDEDEDEDEDDEMEREPGYEAEFERYAQEAAEERYLNTGARGGRDVSFGRKSLNLLRDGFRMPLRAVSGEQKK
ncbi:hypothetical protein PHSY_006405 [Pseudozyma hubeiensis SY62]|uniref:Uncharacterized protein n=1 Tax=Pseudozyma hubeiensis (strain SY62) TaxID=1305764 RepID=R9PL49_PSEHS|nr:hypothetical protein PHSY_006405 [Pseudozyma hubeiensis SY62]GAC98810.1 hypothetical protein PHSY_006405 [Pseudozyma hubeiensis SY62]